VKVARRISVRRKVAYSLIAVGAGLLICAVSAELTSRLRAGVWWLRPSKVYVHDDVLGWAPEPGRLGRTAAAYGGRADYTIDMDGLRSNGQTRPTGEAILATGDSFTFGQEVNDSESWPAELERLLARPVLNWGVAGYGLD